MAQQTINLPASIYSESASRIDWIYASGRPQINASLRGSVDSYLDTVAINSSGVVQLSFAGSADGLNIGVEDLSDLFESSGGFDTSTFWGIFAVG